MGKQITPAPERRRIIDEVEKLRKATGLNQELACKKVGVSPSAFQYWKSIMATPKRKAPVKTGKRVRQPTLTRIATPDWTPGNEQGGLLYALVGAPREVMAALKDLR